jgi:hypothetical protein
MKLNLELHPRQGDAYLSKATEILYGGAAGGGKSHLERVAPISWCREIPKLQVYLFRRTYPELWDTHMTGPTAFPSMLAPITNIGTCKIVDKDIRFANGAEIHLRHCQYEKDVLAYQGPEIHVLIIDEIGQWISGMYKYLRSRVRASVDLVLPKHYRKGEIGLDGQVNGWDLFPRVLLAGNPGGILHNYLKQGWVDHGEELWEAPASEGGMMRQYIPARLPDNPSIDREAYEKRLEGLGSPQLVKAMRDGDWDIVAGGALDDVWNRDRHVVRPFKIPASWRIDRSFDWGSSKPFSVQWWAESDGTEAIVDGRPKSWPRGTIFLIAEWYGWNGNANEGIYLEDTKIGQGIKEREAKFRGPLGIGQYILPGPADSSIFDGDPGKDSIATGIDKGYGIRGLFVKADKSPGSRKNRLEVMRRKLKASLAERMEEPGLFVFDTCMDGFIRTVPVLPRDGNNPDDVDTEAEDHAYDAAGYRLTAPRNEARILRVTGV